MWSFKTHPALFGIATLALLSSVAAKPYPLPTARAEEPRDSQNASQIEKRQQCAGTPCGFYKQLCCTGGQVCMTDANNQALCGNAQGSPSGGWQFYTQTITDVVTKTAVFSTFVGAPNPQATKTCASQWDTPCDTTCCGVGYICLRAGVCQLAGGSTGGGIIATGSPTATVPFSTPIPTGVNGTPIPQEGGGGGLSGGAIAGIVIGVLLGILLLLLICFYCCAKSLFDTILACFGFGKKNRKHTHEETYIEEHRHSSHAGGAAAAAGGRRWYGQSAPSRQSRTKKSGGMGGLLGAGAALGGLALALGLKRKHDKKHDDDKTTSYTGSSAYYSEYTSSSSASSDDRRSRPTRHSSSRR